MSEHYYLLSYDPWLVWLSLLLAIVGAYLSIYFLQRSQEVSTDKLRLYLLGAALTMGTGIWSMHYSAMMAMTMPMSHDPTLTVLSLAIAILYATVSFILLAGTEVTFVRWLLSGLFMGLGISGMHHVGMASMQSDMLLVNDPIMTGISIMIAITVSLVAMFGVIQRSSLELRFIQHGVVAVILGITISGMHYISMYGLRFLGIAHLEYGSHPAITNGEIAVGVLLASVLLAVVLYGLRYFKVILFEYRLVPLAYISAFNLIVVMIIVCLLMLSTWFQHQASELNKQMGMVTAKTGMTAVSMQNYYELDWIRDLNKENFNHELARSIDIVDDSYQQFQYVLASPFLDFPGLNARTRIVRSTDRLAMLFQHYAGLLQSEIENRNQRGPASHYDEIHVAYRDVQNQVIHLNQLADGIGGDTAIIRDVLNSLFLLLIIIMFVVSAIYQRRHASAILRQNEVLEETAEHLISQTIALDEHNIVSIADVDGNIVHANQKFCDVSGYAIEELIGRNHRIINSSHHPDEFWKEMWHTISSGKIWHGRIRNRRKGSGFYWVDSSIIPFLGAGGEPYQYVSVRSDVTNLVEAQNALIETNQSLEQRVSDRTEALHHANDMLKKEKQALELIANNTARTTGQELLNQMVEDIATVLEVENAIIAVVNRDNSEIARTRAVWINGRIQENFQYSLAGMPCNHVLEHGVAFYTDNVMEMFPAYTDVVDMGIDNYLGLSFDDSKGDLLGFISVSSHKPFTDLNYRHAILTLFSQRVASEIEQERILRFSDSVLETAPSIIVVLNVRGEIVRLNKAACDITGYSAEELLGKKVWDRLIPTESIDEVKGVFEKITLDDFPSKHRNPWLTHTGERRMIDWANSAIFDDTGEITFIIATGIDVTEQHRAQEQLLASEKKFRHIFDFSLDGMLLIQAEDLHIVSANRRMAIMCGVALSENLDGRMVDLLFTKDLWPEYLNKIVNMIQAGSSNEFNVPLHRRDGTILYTDVNASQFELEGTKYISAIFHDVTERRNNEEVLRKAYQYKSDFLSTMSHELRTPLNAIIGFAKAMHKGVDGSINEDQKESLDHIIRSSGHLKHLIDDILDMSKLEAERMDLVYSNVDMLDILDNVQKTMVILANEKGIDLTLSSETDLPTITGDKQRLTQIMFNLVSNAVKFTETGHININAGTISGADLMLPEYVRTSFDNGRKYILVSVVDSGIGIAEDDKDKVFDEFRQIDSSTTRRQGGTGLGMAISKRLVEIHHGQIWFESVIGKGSTFSFAIPVEQ